MNLIGFEPSVEFPSIVRGVEEVGRDEDLQSMLSTVVFSFTLSPTNLHAAPFSLKTSVCGSVRSIALENAERKHIAVS